MKVHDTNADGLLGRCIIHANPQVRVFWYIRLELECQGQATLHWSADASSYSRLDEWSVFPREAAVRNIPIIDESIFNRNHGGGVTSHRSDISDTQAASLPGALNGQRPTTGEYPGRHHEGICNEQRNKPANYGRITGKQPILRAFSPDFQLLTANCPTFCP